MLTSCVDNVSMLTVISKDGSVHREICFAADSSSTQNDDTSLTETFMSVVLNDREWTKEWKKVQKDSTRMDSTMMCFASRDFKNVKEMAENYPIRVGGKSILKNCDLKKSFHWFYTDYAFTETYNNYSASFSIPITEYLDKEAASYFLTGYPNILEGKNGYEAQDILDNMNTRYESWITANIMNDVMETIVKSHDSLPGIPLSKEEIVATRDSLIKYAMDNGITLAGTYLGLGRLMDDFYHTDYFRMVLGDENIVSKDLEAKLEPLAALGDLEIDYRLAMPGTRIIDKGYGIIKDNDICYSITEPRLFSPCYTIAATFRHTNVWAYFVTLFIACIAIWLSIRLREKDAKIQ